MRSEAIAPGTGPIATAEAAALSLDRRLKGKAAGRPDERLSAIPVEPAFDEIGLILAGLEEARRALGRYDHVTLLPNRTSFLEDLEHRDPAARRQIVLLTLADARQFNEILRVLGHACSESFIREGGKRVVAAVPGVTVYHVSVLSFAFVVDGETDAEIADILSAIGRIFEPPIVCTGGVPINQRVGVGICALPPAPEPVAEALRSALTAAQDSRNRRLSHARYDRRSDEAQRRAFTLVRDLHRAIETQGELHLVFQPRIELATGRTRSVEALLRWTHPTLGNIPPGEFIPLAEATALVTPLTDWVVDAAARQSARWRADGLDLETSVNVAPANLQTAGFTGAVMETIGRHGLSPHSIEVEITEGTATSADPLVLAQLGELRDAGIEVAIDDFGTGYSNLVYLTGLPATVLKIDQSFIRPMDTDARRQYLVRAVIDMAHGLGYRVVAEGVETRSTYDTLLGWGCDEGQGYLMSRPLAPAALMDWLRAR